MRQIHKWVFCPFVTHHGRPHGPSRPKIYILEISYKFQRKIHSNGSKPVCVYVTMNNLGDELTHVNFSCVLVIFYYN